MVSNTAPDHLFRLLQCLSHFSNTVRFPWPCLSLFAPKADPTPDSALVANVGQMIFAKNGKAFAAKPARNPRNPP